MRFVDTILGMQWPLAYAYAGMRVFPTSADKKPLVTWKDGATTDHTVIAAWWATWAHADCAWALPPDVVVVDVDAPGGFSDFLRLAGIPVDQAEAPRASSARGGRHIFYASQGRRYRNGRIPNTSIDVKASGGFVLLPLPANGREWLRPLLGSDMRLCALPPAPPWLDIALKRDLPARETPVSLPIPLTDDAWVRRRALAALGQACQRIVGAECGAQHTTLNREVYTIGGLIGRGDLTEDEAFTALLAAAGTMVAHTTPWRDFTEEIADTLAAGAEKPLPLDAAERVLRRLHDHQQRLRERAHD